MPCLKPVAYVTSIRDKLNASAFSRPVGLQVGSRKLNAHWKKPESASLSAPLGNGFVAGGTRRTPPSGRQGGQSASRLSHFRCSTSLAQRTGHPGYREPRPVQMGFVAARCHLSPFASFRPASEARGLRNRKPRQLNASVLPSPPGRQSVASFVPAERKPNRRVCPHPFVTQPAHRP
jgi:hypothetical protein